VTDLKYYRDRKHGFSMVYPETWHAYELRDAEGRMFAERPDDFGTCLMIEITKLPMAVTPEDLPALRAGFMKGLRSAPGSRILRKNDYDVGWAVGLEAIQLFDEDGERRKRWVRVLYRGEHQYRLVAQGRSPEEYERWLNEFRPAMTAFQFDGGIAPVYPE
jgi:hypothetical protein